jgi:hypothetical protein
MSLEQSGNEEAAFEVLPPKPIVESIESGK